MESPTAEPMEPKTIVTADGHKVHEGDRVYNYYDCKWGVIGRVDPYPQPDTIKGQTCDTPFTEWTNYWFTHKADDGTSCSLDGSRITIKEPQRR